MPDDFQPLPPVLPDQLSKAPGYDRFAQVDLRRRNKRHWPLIPYCAFLGCVFGFLVAGVLANFEGGILHKKWPVFFGPDGLAFDGFQYGALVGFVVGFVWMCLAIKREWEE
jgi:hypothetical protein